LVIFKWFSEYICLTDNKVSVDSNHFAILMNYALKHNTLELKFEDEAEPDKLYINFLNGKDNKSSFDHFFELNLIDVEEDGLAIPDVDYEVDFTIESKKLVDVLSELNTIGQDLNVKCNQDVVELNANGESAKLKVNIPIDELNEYAIAEGEELNISFSLNHIYKMCCSTKLGLTTIVSLSSEYPMSLRYDLGDDSIVVFYVAPKVSD
jgi:proliferating cell nuclear antigen PCNA